MLAFAAAVVVHTTVRLGWWETVDRNRGDGGDGDLSADVGKPGASGPATPSGPSAAEVAVSAPGDELVHRTAFGGLAGEVSAEHGPDFYVLLGQVYSENREHRLAARMWAAARRQYGAAPHADALKRRQVTLKLARSMWDAGQRAEGLAVLREEVGKMGADPAAVPLWRELGFKAAEAGQATDSVAAFREILRIAPTDRERDDARRQLWRLYSATGQEAKAAESYAKQVEAKPDDEESLRMLLAYRLFQKPDPALAEGYIDRLIALRPDQLALKEAKLQALAVAKNAEGVLTLSEKYAAAEPARAAHFRHHAAGCLWAVGEKERALDLVRSRLESAPDLDGPALAALFHRSIAKDPAAAAAQYSVAAARATGPEASQKYRLQEAECLLDAKQPDRAEAILRPLAESAVNPADRETAKELLSRLATPAPAPLPRGKSATASTP
jgi:tetratricopeptide (TPR) repeat protein